MNEKQFYNGETNVSPTTDGSQHDAGSPKESGASPQAPNLIYPLSKDKVEQLNAAHAGHRDDLALLHRLHPLLTGEQRPRSMAVPWMTTSSSLLQQPSSPVMSMSPQAAYLSKIIPNAVLPPSIDVVEISRGQSRSSVRTVSKSSLLLSSPAPSRASSRASSSRTSSSVFTSASRYNGPNLSDTSCWSNSDSDTLVSDSSTISSSSTSRHRHTSKENRVDFNSSDGTSKVIIKEDQVKKDGQFARSLSVMKTKRPPPPPNRSNSLHSKVKRWSRDLAEVRVIPGEESALDPSGENKPGTSAVLYRSINSPDYNADTSSLDESTGSASFTFIKSQLQEPKAEDSKNVAEIIYKEESHKKQQPLQENKPSKVISPSSGYSSQDGTSPPHRSSPQHKNNNFLTKLHRLFAGSAPPFPAHSEGAENAKPTGEPKSDTVSISPSVQTLRELFNIPPPPKVHAPPPPPPEVWAHSKRTFELLLGPPAPDDVYAIIKKNPKDRRHQRQSPSVSTDSSVKSLVLERKHKNPVTESKTVQESRIFSAEIHKENGGSLAQNGSLKEIYKDEKVRVCDMLSGIFVKAVEKQAVKEEGCQKATRQATEVKTFTDPLPTISLGRISPSPSLQLADHPVQRTITEATEGASVSRVQVTSPESSWPPPPPPMNQGKISRSDETDFPLPPPPLFGEVGRVSPVQVPLKESRLSDDVSSTYRSVKSKGKAEQVTVSTGDEAQKRCSPDKVTYLSTSVPPPPPYTAPPPPTVTTHKVLLPPKEDCPPPPVGSITHVVQEVIPRVPSPDKDASSPVNVEVLAFPPNKITALTPENASQPVGRAAPESRLTPPQSIPPPPPLPSHLQLSEQQIDPPHKNMSLEPETKDLSNSIFIAPQSIPPPIEPIELKPSVIIQTTDDAPPPPPLEFRNPPSLKDSKEPAPSPPTDIPLPPPLPTQIPTSINHQSNLSTENQQKSSASDVCKEPSIITPSLLQKVKLRSINSSPEPLEGQEQASVTAVHKEPTSAITPSLLQMVKLRSVNSSPEPSEAAKEEPTCVGAPSLLQMVKLQSVNNSPEPPEAAKEETKSTSTSTSLQIVTLRSVNNSPEPPEAQEQPEPEATVDQPPPNKQTTTCSFNNETPQKPIRKSLIVPNLTSTSEPSQSLAVSPASPSPVVSPVKKSHTTTTSSVSMNLQEAIRLRTAARSKEGPASRLSLHSPVSPPSTSPSFVFAKSNPVVGVVTKHKQANKEVAQTKSKDSFVAKVASRAESKVGLKMPPPVAKKPKTKIEVEASEATEQTAGQEAQHDGIKGKTTMNK